MFFSHRHVCFEIKQSIGYVDNNSMLCMIKGHINPDICEPLWCFYFIVLYGVFVFQCFRVFFLDFFMNNMAIIGAHHTVILIKFCSGNWRYILFQSATQFFKLRTLFFQSLFLLSLHVMKGPLGNGLTYIQHKRKHEHLPVH